MYRNGMYKRALSALLGATIFASVFTVNPALAETWNTAQVEAAESESVTGTEDSRETAFETESREEVNAIERSEVLDDVMSQEEPIAYLTKNKDVLLKSLTEKEAYQLMLLIRYESVKIFEENHDLSVYMSVVNKYHELKKETDGNVLAEWKNEAYSYTKDQNSTYWDGKTKKVTDYETYAEYLQKTVRDAFEVNAYLIVLGAISDAETEDELVDAKKGYSEFVEATFGFDDSKFGDEEQLYSETESESKLEADTKNESEEAAESKIKTDASAESKKETEPEKETESETEINSKEELSEEDCIITEFLGFGENNDLFVQITVDDSERDLVEGQLPKTMNVKVSSGRTLTIPISWKCDFSLEDKYAHYIYDSVISEPYVLSESIQYRLANSLLLQPFAFVSIMNVPEEESAELTPQGDFYLKEASMAVDEVNIVEDEEIDAELFDAMGDISLFSLQGQTVTLNVGKTIDYGISHTNYFTVSTPLGSSVAYCGQALLSTPPSGNYTIWELDTNSTLGKLIRMILMFGQGGPYSGEGYALVANGNWSQTTVNTSDNVYAFIHEITSYIYYGNHSGPDSIWRPYFDSKKAQITNYVNGSEPHRVTEANNWDVYFLDPSGSYQDVVWLQKKQTETYLAFNTNGGNIPTPSNPNGYYLPNSGYYNLQSVANTGSYIHVENASTASQAPLVLWAGAGAVQAQWYLERYNNTPYYTIFNDKANLYLSGDTGGSVDNGKRVRIKEAKLADGTIVSNISTQALSSNQLWYFTANSDGSVTIHNKANGNQVIALANAGTANGTAVQFYQSNGSSAQKFKLVPLATAAYYTKTKRYGQRSYIPATTPTRSGYTFLNWNTAANGTGTAYAPGQIYTGDPGGTVTFYAQWKANNSTVTYKANGGTGSDQTQSVTTGGSWTTKGAIFSRTGYKLSSWNTAANGSGTKYNISANQSNGKTLTLYAQWTPITYTVKYNGNGNTGGSTASSRHTYNTAKALTANGFSRTGYIFAGWATSTTGSVAYSNKQSVKNLTSTNGATINLYAKWTPNKYMVTYKANGGTGADQSQTVTYGTSWTTKGEIFSRTGYTLTSWNTQADGSGTKYSLNAAQTDKQLSNLTLYAQWTINTYTNKIDHWAFGFKNGEGNNGTSKTAFKLTQTSFNAKYNSTFIMDSSRKVTIPNGFYLLDSFGSSAITGSWANFDMGTSVTQKAASMAFEYRYFPTDFPLTYQLNGGTNHEDNPSTYNVLYGVSLEDPTRKGYEFTGWTAQTLENGIHALSAGPMSNYVYEDIVSGFRAEPGVTYDITMESASGSVEQFTTYIYDFTANKMIASAVENTGNDISYSLTCPENADGSHSLRIIAYAGLAGSTADQSMQFKNARISFPLNGINPGENATFSSSDDLYVKLNSRTAAPLILTANWHNDPPVITGDKKEFYEGQTVTGSDLLKNVVATDIQDGTISDRLKITKIEYPAGKLDNSNAKLDAYAVEYPDGMKTTDKMDTWFLRMDKNDSPITIKVTYEVTDDGGLTTTKILDVLLKYNEYPVIDTEDRYFTLEEAQNGIITSELLLETAIADGDLSSTDIEEGDLTNKIQIVDFDPTAFTTMTGDGTIRVSYKVQDSMGPDGKGKETIRQIDIHIIDGGDPAFRPPLVPDQTYFIRFINQKFYEKNVGLDLFTLTDEEIAQRNANGGLNVMSPWYQDAGYKTVIETSFANTAGISYTYTLDDIDAMRAYVEAHGVGNSQETDALAGFVAQFMN